MKKRRNFDIKSNDSKKSSLALPITITLTLAVLLISSLIFLQKKDSPTDLLAPGSKETTNQSSLSEQNNTEPTKNDSTILAVPDFSTPTNSTPAVKATDSLKIFLDGWSYQLLAKKTISIYDATTNESATTNFKALSKDELTKLYPTNFLAIRSIVARLYPVTGILQCDKEGCRDDKGAIDIFNLLTDLGKTPTLGEQYAKENISQGIYLAEFKIHPTTSGLNLTIEGSPSILVSVPKSLTDEVNPGAVVKPSPFDGYGERAIALGFAFKKPFLLDPLWVSNQGKFNAGSFNSNLSPVTIKQISNKPPLLLLSDATTYLENQLTDSELTFRTSPATGCSSLTICSTLATNPAYTTLSTKNYTFCTSKGKVSGIYWQGKVTLDSKTPIYLGGLYSPNKLSVGSISYFTHALYLLDSSGFTTITSDRSLTIKRSWSTTEMLSYLGADFKICN